MADPQPKLNIPPVFADPGEPGGVITLPDQSQPLPAMTSQQPLVKQYQPSPLEQNIAHDTARLGDLRSRDQNHWGTENNHPGTMGKIAHVFSTLGNIAGDVFAPNVMAMIPGTQLNRQVQEGPLAKRLNAEILQQTDEAGRQAQTEEEQARTDALKNPKPQVLSTSQGYESLTPGQTTAAPIMGPNGEQLQPVEKTFNQTAEEQAMDGAVRAGMSPIDAYRAIKQAAQVKDPSLQQQYLDALQSGDKSTMDSISKTINATSTQPKIDVHAATVQPPHSMMMVPDGKGGFVATEVTPGMTVTPGAVTPTQMGANDTKDEKGKEGANQAINYAKTYINQPHTGPGDEALMEKFFELAKPSSGFRMTQTQIDMLKNAQSWMDSTVAKIRHATVGTWFSDEQRKQIVDTMGNLKAASETKAPSGGGNAPIVQKSPSTGQFRYSTDGGKTWQAGQPK